MRLSHQVPAGGVRELSLRRLARDAAALVGGEFAGLALLLLQSVMVARALGDARLGVWAYLQATVGLPRALLGFRTSEALARFLGAAETSEGDTQGLIFASVRRLETAVSVVTCGIAIVAAPLVAGRVAGQPELTPLFRWYALTALVTWVAPLWQGALRHQREFGRLARLPMQLHLAQVLVLGGCYAFGRLDLKLLVWTSMAHLGLLAALQWRDVRGMAPPDLPLRACWQGRHTILGFWKYMLTGCLENTLRALMSQGDVFILGGWNSNAVVGNYRLAKTVAGALAGLGGSMATVCFQDFNEQLATGRAHALRPYLKRVNRLWLPVVGLAVMALSAASPWLIATVYGPEFELAPVLLSIHLLGSMAGIGLFWGRPLLMAQLELRAWVKLIYATGPPITVGMILASQYLGPIGFTVAYNLMPLTTCLLAAALGWRALGRLAAAETPGS